MATTSLRTSDEKITAAKSIVQAVIHAADHMDEENYDPHWPLSAAIDLLEQASVQLGTSPSRKQAASGANQSSPVLPADTLDLLRGIRGNVEEARSAATCVQGAIRNLNTDSCDEIALMVMRNIDDVLCDQVEKMDSLIERVESKGAQP